MPKLTSTYHPVATTSTPIRGELAPGVDCYVLGPSVDDHRVSKRAVLTALTLGAKHAKSDRYIERIPAQFLAEVGLDPMGLNLVPVTLPDQPTAHTYSATDFVRILTAYTKWLASGTMRKDQEHLGRNAAGVLATFASLGVVTAIRRACGVDQTEDTPALVPVVEKMSRALETLAARLDALELRSRPQRGPVLPPPPPPPARGPAPSVSSSGLVTVGGVSLQLHRVGDGWGCYAVELGRALGYANGGRKFLSYLCPTGHWFNRFLANVHVVRHPRVMLTLEGMRLACILSRSKVAAQLLPALASSPAASATVEVDPPDPEDDRRGPPRFIRPAGSLPFLSAVCTGDTLWVCPELLAGASAGDRQMQALLRGLAARWGMPDAPRLGVAAEG